MNTGASFGANINWPLVAGLGVAAAVLFYALYIVDAQLQQLDALGQGAASSIANAASAITSPLQTIEGWFNADGSGT